MEHFTKLFAYVNKPLIFKDYSKIYFQNLNFYCTIFSFSLELCVNSSTIAVVDVWRVAMHFESRFIDKVTSWQAQGVAWIVSRTESTVGKIISKGWKKRFYKLWLAHFFKMVKNIPIRIKYICILFIKVHTVGNAT